MTHAPLGAQSAGAGYDRAHQLIRMQTSFHQDLRLAGGDKPYGFFGGIVAVRRRN